jgi:pyruvate formate lyase activating enzyme
MEIKGFIDVSLSDWDGKVSSVIFLPQCNFRCPFCYNTNLVLKPETMPTIKLLHVEDYLEANRKWIDGAVLTGGEPTIHKDLPNLCRRLKEMRFRVKVDTNGTDPIMIRRLVDSHLVDYVALDVKAPLTEHEYSLVTGVKATSFVGKVSETIRFLLEGHVDYEFRTTLVPKLHEIESVEKICQALKGCKKYMLQNFKSDVETVDPKFKEMQPFSSAQLQAFVDAAQKIVAVTRLRS